MFYTIFFLFPCFFPFQTHQDQSVSVLSAFGYIFVPIDSSIGPFLTLTVSTTLRCHVECNQKMACRTFDFDQDSSQCRLWSEDLTTGMISLVSPSKPRSRVGSITLTPSTYAPTHNQPCAACAQSRYETCDPSSSTCQCPPVTFWNGTMCLPQRFLNQSCSTLDSCRSDLNLGCQDSGCNSIYRCSYQTTGVGVTVAGYCNATSGGGAQGLTNPWNLYVSSDNTLYVSDYTAGRVQAYPSLSRFGVTIMATNGHIEDVFVDSALNVYMSFVTQSIVFISPANISFPRSVSTACNMSAIYAPHGVTVDSHGNIYVSDSGCHVVMKWLPNATTGILVAGQLNVPGSSSQLLNNPKCIFLDESQSALYVADNGNQRVQKFILGANRTGITVAGGHGLGSAMNQLNYPLGVWVSKKDQSIYVGDSYNNRVMKWNVNATQGSVIAGVTGVAGNTALLLNNPGDVALDPTEAYLYVADYDNSRVQRFLL